MLLLTLLFGIIQGGLDAELREQLIVRATQSVKDIEKVRARLDTSEAPK